MSGAVWAQTNRPGRARRRRTVDKRLASVSHARADSSSMTVGSWRTRRHRAMNAKLSTMPNDMSTSDPGPGIPIRVPEPPGPDLVPDPAPPTDPRPPDTQPSPDPQLPPDPRLPEPALPDPPS